MADLVSGVFRFDGYRVIDIQFSCNAGFEFDSINNGEMRFDFVKASSPIENNRMQLNLRCRVFYSSHDNFDTAPYKISIELAGIFSSDNEFNSHWENNALAILFPYVRSLIGSITSQSGRNAVILPTVNISKLFENSESCDENLI